jgi:murein DD-endopeptidase MepM/ murein hydrolase activator NlpD
MEMGVFRRLVERFHTEPRFRRAALGGIGVLAVLTIFGGYQLIWLAQDFSDPRSRGFVQWQTGDAQARAELITVQRETCPGAPFILPTDGYIGLLYGDPRGPYSAQRPHQGIDIFSPGEAGVTPVYAAYDGYLTRQPDWKSSLIIRVPDDPLQPGRQIWLYYTHMAAESGDVDYIEESFPPGTVEVFVRQGTLLGYTGDYNGASVRRVWVHLHFSIVQDGGSGNYANELEFNNTIDPSRYLGMAVNYGCVADTPVCAPTPLCAEAVLGAGGG